MNALAQDLEEAAMARALKRLVPFLLLIYVIAYIDRTNIGFAALSMNRELGLSATAFGFANTAFYLTFALFQVPSNMLLEKRGARDWIPRIMIAWGLASAATVLAVGSASLYGIRAVLGMAEAGILPGILYYLSLWFPKAYRARANAIFLAALPLSLLVGSPLSALFLQLDGVLGLSGWRWLFLLEAVPALVMGAVAYRILPARVEDAPWLSGAEKGALRARLDSEGAPQGPSQGPGASVWRELMSLDVFLIAVGWFALAATLNTLGVWLPQIVKELLPDSSRVITIGLVTAISPLIALITMPFITRSSDRSGDRVGHTIFLFTLAAAGWALTALAAVPALRLLGLVLCSIGAYPAYPIYFAMASQRLSQRGQAVGIAAISTMGLAATVVSPPIVGKLRDLTASFNAGIWYAVAMLVIGVAAVWLVHSRAKAARAA